MNYRAYFESLDGVKYKVEIVTNTGDTNFKEVKLAGEQPVVVNYTTADNLFDPVRKSTCSVRFIVDDYPLDIYSGKANGTEVNLYKNIGKGGKDVYVPEWMGYVQPNLYDQGYCEPIEELEVVASDYISTLQYYDYKILGSKKNLVSFFDIMKKICNMFPKLQGFYYSLSTFYNDGNVSSEALRLEKMYISEENFFSTEDEPWKLSEVVEEMMKFLGMTIYQDKSHFIITDFSNRKNAAETVQYYPKDRNYSGWVTSYGTSKSINSNNYKLTGADMSLDDVYNKISVKDNFYNIENLLPDLFDKKKLRNLNGADDAIYTRKAFLYQNKYEPSDVQQGDCYYKFYDHKDWTQHCYSHQKLEGKFNEIYVPDNFRADTTSMRNYISSSLLTYAFKTYYKDEKLDFKDYLVLCAHNTPQIISGSYSERDFVPLIDTTSIAPMIYGSGAVLLLSATVCFTFYIGRPYINTDPKIAKKEIKEPKFFQGFSGKYDDVKLDYLDQRPELVFKLRINGQWWNGSSWQSQECHFKARTGLLETSSFFNTDVQIQNNVKGTSFIGDIGYRIDMPPLGHTANDIYFGICQCKPLTRVKNGGSTDYGEAGNAYAWISNVCFKVVREGQQLWSNDDVIYENVIDEDNVIEGPEITCKITSDAGKTFSFSNVGVLDYADDILPLVNVKKKDFEKSQRPEENIVEAYVNQYSTPSIKENVTLDLSYNINDTIKDNYWNKDFLVMGVERDYAYDRQTMTLIEKK